MNTKNIKLIIFDLGNVVIKISFDKMYRFWAEILNMDYSQAVSRFHFDSFYESFERGEIDGGAYYRHVNTCLGGKLSFENFITGWNSIYIGIVPGIKTLLLRLKKNYKIIALTNTNELHHPMWKELYKDVLACFDFIYCSFELKMRKPDKAIFNYILRANGVKPEEALFLDDNEDNIKQAVSMGISSILAGPSINIVEKLDQYLSITIS